MSIFKLQKQFFEFFNVFLTEFDSIFKRFIDTNVVSNIYNNAAAISELHAKGAELSLDFATDGIAVPFAAGAAKFYAENGITVDTAA